MRLQFEYFQEREIKTVGNNTGDERDRENKILTPKCYV